MSLQGFRRKVFIGFLIKDGQRLIDYLTAIHLFFFWCNWLEINILGTNTDRSPTDSKSNFNWSVSFPKLVGDLSDGTILWRDQCAIKYVTKAQHALYWNRNSHTSYLNSRLY